MEVRPGYRQTEVGVIPEDWEIKTLGSVFTLKHGFAFSSDYFSKSGPIVLTPGNFRLEGGLYFELNNTKRYSGPYSSAMTFRKGDLLIVMTDLTPDCNLLGKPAFVDSDELVLHNQRIGKVQLKEKSVDTRMLFYLLLSRQYLGKIKEQATGSTVRHASNKSIYSVQLAWPSLPEQSAIADALTVVDGLLSGLDRLIAKKRDLKQAAMQQLLTGQTRLPGFDRKLGFTNTEIGLIPEDWILAELREVVRSHRQGYYTTTPYSNDGVKLVRITDLMNPRLDYTTMPMLRITQNDRYLYSIRRGDFLFARSGAIGRYGIVYNDIDAIFGSYIIRFTFDSTRLVNEFFGYLYQMRRVWRQLLAITQGSSNININASNIKSIKIPLPSADEQTAIAEVLTTMDSEIAALEQRREKTRALKQAMMQELLTGKTRLI